MNTRYRTTVIAVVTALVVVGTLGTAGVGAAGDGDAARTATAGQVSTAAGETCGFEGQRRITNESTAALPPTASPVAVADQGDDRLVVGINGSDFGARETTAWLVRNGAVVDQAALGPVGREAAAPDVVATADGGYVIAGTIGGVESDSDAFVAKLGADLASEWFVRVSTPASDTGAAVVRAPGGGYTALVNQGSSRLRLGAASNGSSGTTDADGAEVRPAVEIVRPISGDVRLVHVAGDGTRVWNRTIASPDARAGVALAVGANDSGYLVGGASYPDGGQLQPRGTTDGVTAAATTDQAFLLRTNGTGEPVWNRTYGASAGPTVEVADVRPTGDGYVAAGTVDGSNGTDPWLVEVDDGGAVQWSRSFGRSDVDEAGLSVGVTDPGEYLVGGFGVDASGQATSWLFETGGDAAGNGTWWRESINGTGPGTSDVERVGGDAFLVVGNYGGSVTAVSTGTDGGVSTAATTLDGPGLRRIQLGGDQPFPDGIDGLAPPTNTGPEPGYEDVDGDGKFTFLDVVTFNLAPPSALDADRDAAAVDYDCSGTVDFMDVVELLFRL